MDKFFISYNRVEQRRFVNTLRTKIQPFETWQDVNEVEPGFWRPQVQEAIRNSIAVIFVVSPASIRSANVNYELAYALGADVEIIPVIFKDEVLPFDFKEYDSINFTDEQFDDLNWKKLNDTLRKSSSRQIMLRSRLIIEECRKIEKRNPAFQRNRCFNHVILKSLSDLHVQLQDVTKEGVPFSIPTSLYPYYLISLQKEKAAIVKAVSLVDKDEFFWQKKAGHEIMRTASKDGLRIFVFYKEIDFINVFPELVKYAGTYHIYAVSLNNLKTYCNEEDFSIIDIAGDKVLVQFDDTKIQPTICFTTNPEEIARYDDRLQVITKNAVKIERSLSPEDAERMSSEVFQTKPFDTGEKNTNRLETFLESAGFSYKKVPNPDGTCAYIIKLETS